MLKTLTSHYIHFLTPIPALLKFTFSSFFHGCNFRPYPVMKESWVWLLAFHKMSLKYKLCPSFFMISFPLWLSYLSTVAMPYANGYLINTNNTLTPHNSLDFYFCKALSKLFSHKNCMRKTGQG